MKKRIVSVLVSLCLLLGMLPVMALAEGPDSQTYLALGDSITTGYRLGSGEQNFAQLVEAECGFTLDNQAENGETSQTLLAKLTSQAIDTSEADLITITIGGNDLMLALYDYLAEQWNGDNPEAGMDREGIQTMLQGGAVNAATLEALIGYLPGFTNSTQARTALSNLTSNLGAIVAAIKGGNPDVQLLVCTQYNPYRHLAKTYGTLVPQAATISTVFDAGVSALNGIIRTAAAGGQFSVVDVYTVFENAVEQGQKPCNPTVNPTNFSIDLDYHPNAVGHSLIAGAIEGAIQSGEDTTGPEIAAWWSTDLIGSDLQEGGTYFVMPNIKPITISFSAQDQESGIKSVSYQLTGGHEQQVTLDQAHTYSFTMEEEFTGTLTVKAEDNAGNVSIVVFQEFGIDFTPPTIQGVDNGGTYYATQRITVSDQNLESLTVNGQTMDDNTAVLPGDCEGSYDIVARDKAGNETSVTVTMKPIASLAAELASLTVDNVTLGDQADIEAVKETAKENITNASQEEKAQLEGLTAVCDQLLDKIQEVETALEGLNAAMEEMDSAGNRAQLETLCQDIQQALECYAGNLTEAEQEKLEKDLEQVEEMLEGLPETSGDYEITAGAGGKWVKGTQNGLSFTANGAYGSFTGIQVDGQSVDAKNYTAESGSTVITLKPEYLETLAVGSHTLKVQYTDGQASCQFEIQAKSAAEVPDTGDHSQFTLWLTLLFLSCTGVMGTMIFKRRGSTAQER